METQMDVIKDFIVRESNKVAQELMVLQIEELFDEKKATNKLIRKYQKMDIMNIIADYAEKIMHYVVIWLEFEDDEEYEYCSVAVNLINNYNFYIRRILRFFIMDDKSVNDLVDETNVFIENFVNREFSTYKPRKIFK